MMGQILTATLIGIIAHSCDFWEEDNSIYTPTGGTSSAHHISYQGITHLLTILLVTQIDMSTFDLISVVHWDTPRQNNRDAHYLSDQRPRANILDIPLLYL